MAPRVDFKSQRIFVEHALEAGADAVLSHENAHHLLTVLRMESGTQLLAFNGRDGEWRVALERTSKRAGSIRVLEQTRGQTPRNALTFLFAPIKKDRLDWLVQKAVEMGAGTIAPVITEHTQNPKLRQDKLAASIIDAAQQCGVLAVPELEPVRSLTAVLDGWDERLHLIFCDEHSEVRNPLEALGPLKGRPLALLVGPEGGFSQAERQRLLSLPFVTSIALGPRILRADTAAVAALAAVQMAVGDWG